MTEPITSYGIINIYLDGELKYYNNILKDAFNNNAVDTTVNIYDCSLENLDNFKLSIIKSRVIESLLILLVSRKHSLGYVEFIRGRYDTNDFKTVEHLLYQMTDLEIYNIFNYDFDTLWSNMWKKNAKKNIYHKEYAVSKERFTIVNDKLSYQEYKPTYPTSEWGFPKGRKNSNETDISCAIRECCEESTLFKSELNILSNVSPIIELMTGTNNITYKHIYYISVANNIRSLYSETNNLHFIEVDTAGWFKKNRIINLLRPYHTEKFKIVDKIIDFISYVIYCHDCY